MTIFNRLSIETMVGTQNSENFDEKSRENDLTVDSILKKTPFDL